MTDLFPHDTVWVLDDYSNTVKERKVKAVAKDNELRARWKEGPLVTFTSPSEAWAAAVERAKKDVAKAEAQLRNERARLLKCQKRLAAIGASA